MPEAGQVGQVLRFAALLGASADSAREVAREHGWLDPSSRITETGRQLHRALTDQRATRSIYRNLF